MTDAMLSPAARDVILVVLTVCVLVLLVKDLNSNSGKSRDGANGDEPNLNPNIFRSGSNLANVAGSVRTDAVGDGRGLEGLGGIEPPVFWHPSEVSELTPDATPTGLNVEGMFANGLTGGLMKRAAYDGMSSNPVVASVLGGQALNPY